MGDEAREREDACRYCGRQFPAEADVEAHLSALRSAGMLEDHKEIHGKGGNGFQGLDLDVDPADVSAPRDDEHARGFSWWVDAFTRRGGGRND